MKIQFLIYFLLINVIMFGQEVDPNTYWLSVDTKIIDKSKASFSIPGLILKIDKENSVASRAYSDSLEIVNLNIQDSILKLVETNQTLAKVKFSSKERLVMDIEGANSRATFLPIPINENLKLNLDFWKNTDWILEYTNHNENIIFSDSIASSGIKISYAQTYKNDFRLSVEKQWFLKKIEGNVLLYSNNNGIKEYFVIEKQNRDEIYLKSLELNPKIVKLTKQKSITKEERIRITKTIVDHKWKTSRLITFKNNFDEEKNKLDLPHKISYPDTLLIPKKALIKNRLSFLFKENGKYQMLIRNKLLYQGNWVLSDSGEQIIVNPNEKRAEIIDLYEVDSNSMIIGKENLFSQPKKEIEQYKYYYKLELSQ